VNKSVKIIGKPLPNIPWEEKAGRLPDRRVGATRLTRSSRRNAIPCANSIFNSAVVPYQGKFAAVFRVDDTGRQMQLHVGRSVDGIGWKLQPQRIEFACNPTECDCSEVTILLYGYDPRVVWIEDRYYVTWCNAFHGPTIGIGYTYDFETVLPIGERLLAFQTATASCSPAKSTASLRWLSRPTTTGTRPLATFSTARVPICASGQSSLRLRYAWRLAKHESRRRADSH
jgi:beta-1,4-mannooligosaccharide/beta-1,4-mannosyl-N-acetylglucosamine phosphorylase